MGLEQFGELGEELKVAGNGYLLSLLRAIEEELAERG